MLHAQPDIYIVCAGHGCKSTLVYRFGQRQNLKKEGNIWNEHPRRAQALRRHAGDSNATARFFPPRKTILVMS